MASEEDATSDSCNISVRPVPSNLLPYVKSRVLHYMYEAKDISAEIQQTSETDARLVFYHRTKSAEERETESEVHCVSETAAGKKMIVKNIPQSVDEELLELFFESGKKVGAGPVKSMQLDREKNWAIIEFCEPSSVEAVMNKKPLILLDTTLVIHPYEPLLQGGESINNIEMRVLSSELTQDILSVQTEGVPDSYAASHHLEAAGVDDPERTVVSEEETISNLKPVQLKMLSITNFPASEEQKCLGVKVKIDHRKNKIVFKGVRADIMHTKLNMFETLSNFSIRVLNIPESHAELFRAKRVQEYIAAKLETKNLVCAWEVKGSDLVICSSEAHIDSCVNNVSESVKEEIIPATVESVGILYSCEWPAKLTVMHRERKFIFKVHSNQSSKKIHVISTDDVFGEVMEIIRSFLRSKVNIQKETMYNSWSPLPSHLFHACKHYPALMQIWLGQIEYHLSMHHVSIQICKDALKLEGTRKGIELAKTRLSKL